MESKRNRKHKNKKKKQEASWLYADMKLSLVKLYFVFFSKERKKILGVEKQILIYIYIYIYIYLYLYLSISMYIKG